MCTCLVIPLRVQGCFIGKEPACLSSIRLDTVLFMSGGPTQVAPSWEMLSLRFDLLFIVSQLDTDISLEFEQIKNSSCSS